MKNYLNSLSKEVISAAIDVHRELGPGLLESTYELCLHHELLAKGLASERQVALPVQYKDLSVPEAYCIDLLVENSLVLELKTVDALSAIHSAQLFTYLRMSGKHLGLLINFQSIKLADGIGIKRLVRQFPA